MRRLLILASAMVFFDIAFYSAIAPLLPDYVSELGLSKGQAGVLTASYAVGTLFFALPSGFVATRFGPRRTVIGGLLLLGCASLAFGLAHLYPVLLGARLVQGAAGSLTWAGAMSWLITAAPEEERGSVIGTAMGTAIAGALLGPALGALAASIGTGPVFGSMLFIALGLAYLAARTPEVRAPERQGLREVVETMVSRPVAEAATFVTAPSLMFGAVEVLAPLRINALGGGHAVIAAGFIAGAGLEAVLSPIAGRFADRSGRRLPYVMGMAICAVAMLGIGLAATLGGTIAALVATSLGAGFCFTPAIARLSDVAEQSSLHQGFAAGLSNMAWSMGQVLGGIGGGVLAGLTGNAAPSVIIAVLMLATAAYAARALGPAPRLQGVEG